MINKIKPMIYVGQNTTEYITIGLNIAQELVHAKIRGAIKGHKPRSSRIFFPSIGKPPP